MKLTIRFLTPEISPNVKNLTLCARLEGGSNDLAIYEEITDPTYRGIAKTINSTVQKMLDKIEEGGHA